MEPFPIAARAPVLAEKPLLHLPVLFVDCQTTGATPASGQLLEAAWTVGSAAGASEAAETHRFRLPGGTPIPPAVRRLTGIDDADPSGGEPSIRIRRRLRCALRSSCGQGPPVAAVIHYARFERPFLDRWFGVGGAGRPFPLPILCTHEIARRLYPGLPRRGIRALSGYLGGPVPGHRRSAVHVAATRAIWRGMVEALAAGPGVRTLEALLQWLEATPVPPKVPAVYPMPVEARAELSDGPGIYRMRRKNGELLYIGKAACLKRRVSQYFQRSKGRPEHILEMLAQAAVVDAVETASALEAALLESDEIKKSAPPYNKALQTENRCLQFVSLDGGNRAPKPDRAHCLGPLLPAEARSLAALGMLAAWLQERARSNWDGRLPPPEAIVPFRTSHLEPGSCWSEGLERFRERNGLRRPAVSPRNRLLELGRRLWARRWTEETDPDRSEAEGDADDPPAGDREAPDPESVARALESMIRHAAHGLRRARWFCLLSESSLSWTPRGGPGGERHGWILQCGAPIKRVSPDAGRTPPIPPGWRKGCRSRQRSFDLAAYDRMRVLTTELRRLASESRDVELRFGPDRRVETDALAEWLRWL